MNNPLSPVYLTNFYLISTSPFQQKMWLHVIIYTYISIFEISARSVSVGKATL